MKRFNNLYDDILGRENLRLAVAKALRGKRDRGDARAFCARLDQRLTELCEQLMANQFRFGMARQFMIHDPKPRLITAPRFSERVVHHAIMNICEPVLDAALIRDTYACRKGRGREACVIRAQQFARSHGSFLKLDIRKYFDSVHQPTLLSLLSRQFKETKLLHLFASIIESYQTEPARGLPIGSLISQHAANFYLSGVDHYIKEELRVKAYVRYMDDMMLWSDDRKQLAEWRDRLVSFIAEKRLLVVKPIPFINRTQHGVDFLGCRVFQSHCQLSRRSRLRFRRKLGLLHEQLVDGAIDEEEFQTRSGSLSSFTKSASARSWTVRTRTIQTLEGDGY
jgi:retron-type reverse transcriptase